MVTRGDDMIYDNLKLVVKEILKQKPREMEIAAYCDVLSNSTDIVLNFKDEYSKKKKLSDFYNRVVKSTMDKAISLERKEKCASIGKIFKKYIKEFDYTTYYITTDNLLTYSAVYKINAILSEVKTQKILEGLN